MSLAVTLRIGGALLDLDQPALGGHLDHLLLADDDVLEREVDRR